MIKKSKLFSIKERLVNQALQLGFDQVRFARAEEMVPERQRLRLWLDQGRHGTMKYMENHFEKRTDPRDLVSGAKTVICLSYNYFTEERQRNPEAPKLSKYAFGRDYHKVVKKKLKQLFQVLQREVPGIGGRYFVDSAPVLERDWARRSGLGWMGKNTMIIHPKKGSYFFLAELIVDLEIEPDDPIKDYCGTCTRCIDACPTEAIDEKGYLMDGSKCISYLTIEYKGDIPTDYLGKMDQYMYGCDICQEVCPWNRFSVEHSEDEFLPSALLMEMTREDWEILTEETFQKLFFGSAVQRTQYQGLKRNIDFLKKGGKI